MKKGKTANKAIAFSTALVLLVNIILSMSGFFVSATEAELELGFQVSKTDIKPGEEAEVTVSLKNYDNTDIKDITGLSVYIKINTALFEFVEYEKPADKTIAEAVLGDMLGTNYNVANTEVRFIYASTNDSEIPFNRNNVDLFKFKVKAINTITTDTTGSLTVSSFKVTDSDGGRTVTAADSANINILVENPVILLNDSAPAETVYTNNVTVKYNKGSATVKKDGGTPTAISSGYVADTNGTYEITVTDAVGNTKTETFTIELGIASIAMKSNPTKTSYAEGQTLDVAGGVIEITYSNGSKSEVQLTAEMCDVTNVGSELGSKTVTVTYAEKSTSFDINVVSKTLSSISIKTQPSKISFIEGNSFEADGVITLHYDNGTTEDKNITAGMCSGYNMNQTGVQTVTVTEGGKTATYQITVNAKSVTSIEVTTAPSKTSYIEGQVFDKTGMTVTAYYDNGTNAVITDYTVETTPLTVGKTSVTVSYLGKTATTPITVAAKQLTKIEVTKNPNTTTYKIGNTFSAAGGEITLYYDNESTETVAITTQMCSEYNMNNIGTQTVKVVYQGKETSFNIIVQDKSLESISIKTQPSKKTFIEGNSFEADGVITLHYDNGTTEDKNITAGMCSGYNMNQTGVQTVTVTESGKTATYQITVNAKSVTSIEVTTAPLKTSYIEGQVFDKTGMTVTAYYDNGTNAVITDYTVETAPLTVGKTSVTVSYSGKTATTPITVAAKQLTKIEITTAPSKTSYIEGQVFDKAGMIVTAYYDNETNEAITNYTVETESLTVGKTSITVSYLGKAAEVAITVKAKSLESISIKTQPSKKTFIEGNSFEADGVITLNYDNDTTEDKNITAGMCSGYDMNEIGNQTVTITESGKTATYQITVNAKSVTGIEVTTAPSKTSYIEGQDISITGAVIEIDYNNGTSENMNVTLEMISGYDKNTVGQQTITVTYQGKTASFDITVNAKSLENITIKSMPEKTVYLQGQDFDVAGLLITATYDNGTAEDIAVTGGMIGGYDKNTAGEQTVTITYNTKAANFEVTVISRTNVDALVADIDEIVIDELTAQDKENIDLLLERYDNLSQLEKDAVTNKSKLDEALAAIDLLLFPEFNNNYLEGKIGVEAEAGVIPFDAVLNMVEKEATQEALEKIKEKLGNDSIVLSFLDIDLKDADGNNIQPNGMVKFRIKLDEQYASAADLVAIYISDSGEITVLEAAFEDGYAIFETDHFSNYAIIKTNSENNTESSEPQESSPEESKNSSEAAINSNTSDKISSETAISSDTSDKTSSSDDSASTKSEEENKTSSSAKNPNTGDEFFGIIWTALLVSAAGVLAVFVKKRNSLK